MERIYSKIISTLARKSDIGESTATLDNELNEFLDSENASVVDIKISTTPICDSSNIILVAAVTYKKINENQSTSIRKGAF